MEDEKNLLGGIGILCIGLIIGGYFLFFYEKPQNNATINWNPTRTSGGTTQQVVITQDNLASYLSQNQMIKDLPNGATMLLRFYNFNTGERAWERSFILTKGSATEGMVENADITIILASKYLSKFNGSNLCSVIKEAKANGDMGIDSPLSKVSLLWKFKSMTEYRDCLGF